MPDKHEAIHTGWLDGSEGDLNRTSHEETKLSRGLDFKIRNIGGLTLSEILIKLGLVFKILKIMSINLEINLTHNKVNSKSYITLAIILTPENFPSDT